MYVPSLTLLNDLANKVNYYLRIFPPMRELKPKWHRNTDDKLQLALIQHGTVSSVVFDAVPST